MPDRYEELIAVIRAYAESQKACGYPARLQDLKEFRQWKNMPQDPDFDARLLGEVNGVSNLTQEATMPHKISHIPDNTRISHCIGQTTCGDVRHFTGPIILETDNWDMLESASGWLETGDEVILVLRDGKKLRLSVVGS